MYVEASTSRFPGVFGDGKSDELDSWLDRYDTDRIVQPFSIPDSQYNLYGLNDCYLNNQHYTNPYDQSINDPSFGFQSDYQPQQGFVPYQQGFAPYQQGFTPYQQGFAPYQQGFAPYQQITNIWQDNVGLPNDNSSMNQPYQPYQPNPNPIFQTGPNTAIQQSSIAPFSHNYVNPYSTK